MIQAIGLRREQQKRMDAIFDAHKPAILDSYKGFLKAQTNLTTVNKDPQANKDTVFSAIDALNQARASLQKAIEARPSPLIFTPDLAGQFVWTSARSGVFTPSEPMALGTNRAMCTS